jgi:Zn-finger nucleic acid-binding protein
MSLAFALDFREIEADPSILDRATKDCPACDVDNPRHVSREGCETCGGSGQVGLSAGEIAKEIKASRNEKPEFNRGVSSDDDEGGGEATETYDEDLFLED